MQSHNLRSWGGKQKPVIPIFCLSPEEKLFVGVRQEVNLGDCNGSFCC